MPAGFGSGDLSLLLACIKAWVVMYICFCFDPIGLSSSVSFHVFGVAFLFFVTGYFRLPPPDAAHQFQLLGCDPRNLDGSPSKTRGVLGLVAHRAAGLDGPENSLEALRLAVKNGAKCVEFDVMVTADEVPVVFHDDQVDRMTEGKGSIRDMTLSEVRKLDLASKHALRERFTPCRIPTMEEFVDECLALDVRMIIDLKIFSSIDSTAEMVVDFYRRKPQLYSLAMSSCFDPRLIYAIRRKEPRIVCSLAWRPYFLSHRGYFPVSKDMPRLHSSPIRHHTALLANYVMDWMFHNIAWYVTGVSAVLVHKDVLTPEYVQTWRERGIRLMAWTVNSSLERLYLERSLHVTCLSDTMDEIGLDNLLLES